VFNIRIKLEQFQLAKGQDGKCSSDSFSISIQQSGWDSVDRTRLLCGVKDGLESKKLKRKNIDENIEIDQCYSFTSCNKRITGLV
jgi:hypothetical protein